MQGSCSRNEADRWGRMLLVVLLVGLLSGCSVRFVYNNADRLAVWQAGEYVDLDRAQRDWLRARMRVFMHWHRTQQLPEWASTLRSFELAVRDGVDGTELDALYLTGERWYDDMLVQLQPTAVEFLSVLTEEQIAELPEAFARRNAELDEDYAGLDAEAQRVVWMREMRDAMDPWVGRLNARQELLLEAASTEVVPDNSAWVSYRERWQEALLEALARRDEPGVLADAFAHLSFERESYYTDAYARVREVNDVVYREFTLQLLRNLDDAQRERLSKRLTDLAEDFEALVAEAGEAPEDPGPPPG